MTFVAKLDGTSADGAGSLNLAELVRLFLLLGRPCLQHRATRLLLMVIVAVLCLVHARCRESLPALVDVCWPNSLHHFRILNIHEVILVRRIAREAVHWHPHDVSFKVVLQNSLFQ